MMCMVGGREWNGWAYWGSLLCRDYRLNYAKFCVCDMSRLSRLRLFQHCCIFAHCVTKMPLRRKRTDAKTQKRKNICSVRLVSNYFLIKRRYVLITQSEAGVLWCNLPGTLGHMAMFVLAFMVTVYHRIIYAVYVQFGMICCVAD